MWQNEIIGRRQRGKEMEIYHITDAPLRIYGLAVADRENRRYWKLPPEILEQFPQYEFLGRRCAGGRVRFCTDSGSLLVRMTLAETKEDINIPLSGSGGADIYLGKGKEARFLGYVAPTVHVMHEITEEKVFQMSGSMETVTINLPRNDHLLSMEIGIEDGAVVEEAPEYDICNPIVFYGSSITEGGCASRPGNAYTSIVSRWLDADYRNMGFSGRARGEEGFAEYLAGMQDMSLFVMDYDHNAPDPGFLQKTHEPFFRIIRKAHPELPIVILSRPDTDKSPEDSRRRRDIIRQTYRNALEAGDRKVWFVDGGTFFGSEGRGECTVDGTHPNALGFMRMAQMLHPLLGEILKGISNTGLK